MEPPEDVQPAELPSGDTVQALRFAVDGASITPDSRKVTGILTVAMVFNDGLSVILPV